jgi:uncharacterized membrane protein YeaQ/YmgE (transglycosylase-associated protein family)
MLVSLGLETVPTEMLYFLAFMAIAASIAFGWTTDLILKDRGFGPLGNALIGIIGAFLGPRIWFIGLRHGALLGADPGTLLACAGAGGSLLLVAAALLKRALVRI